MAFSIESTKLKAKSVWENAIEQGVINPYFTIWLDKKNVELGDVAGQLTFGGLDSENCQSNDVQYYKVENAELWKFTFEKLIFNGKPFGDQSSYKVG